MTQATYPYTPGATAPAYPPQIPTQPFQAPPAQYPAQQYAPQQYPQQFMPGFAAPPAAPAVPLAQGSIDDFFSQPTAGGGKSLAFNLPVVLLGGAALVVYLLK